MVIKKHEIKYKYLRRKKIYINIYIYNCSEKTEVRKSKVRVLNSGMVLKIAHERDKTVFALGFPFLKGNGEEKREGECQRVK